MISGYKFSHSVYNKLDISDNEQTVTGVRANVKNRTLRISEQFPSLPAWAKQPGRQAGASQLVYRGADGTLNFPLSQVPEKGGPTKGPHKRANTIKSVPLSLGRMY